MKISFLIISAIGIIFTILLIVNSKNIVFKCMFCIICLFLISFTFSLDKQQKRQQLHVAELKDSQKSDKPQRIWFLITVGIVILLGIGYFFIGKQAQQPPEIIPDSYFEATRLDPNLSDKENGYIQFGNIFGTTRDSKEVSEKISEKYPYEKRDGSRYNEEQQARENDKERYRDEEEKQVYKNYPTISQLLEKTPERFQYLEILENSDFFPQLEQLTEMQRQDNEMFIPTIHGIQGVIRSLRHISIYYTEQGNYQKAIQLNILQLKLANKYLTSHGSLVQELIAIVCMNISHDTTQQLLKYNIPRELKHELLEVYNTTLTIDKDILRKNTFISEYHMYHNLTNNFQLSSSNSISIIWWEKQYIEYLPLTEPFFNKTDTINRLKYWLRLLAEGKTPEQKNEHWIPTEIVNQKRNYYNIFGNMVIESLFPRLQGVQIMSEKMYQTHQEIIQQLKK